MNEYKEFSWGVKSGRLIMLTYSTNSMVCVPERTIPTERPPLVGEVIADFLRIKGATWSA
jgi:hypothetical protein